MHDDVSPEVIIENCKRTHETLNRISGYPAFVYNSIDVATTLFMGPPKNVYMELPESAVPNNEGLPLNCLEIIRQFVIENDLRGHVGFTPIVRDGRQITLPRLAIASMTPQEDLDRITEPFANLMQRILLTATPVSVLKNLLDAWEVRWNKGSFDPADKPKLIEAMYYARKPPRKLGKQSFSTTDEMLDTLIVAQKSTVSGIRNQAVDILSNLDRIIPALKSAIDEKRGLAFRPNPTIEAPLSAATC